LTGLETTVIFPIHPRTDKMIELYKSLRRKLYSSLNINVVPPMGHVEFLNFLQEASLVITDSGGVQVEASILKVPCVTIRERTEWMETVKAGFNFVVDTDSKAVKSTVKKLLDSNYKKVLRKRSHPFAGIRASNDMIKTLMKEQVKSMHDNFCR